MAVLAYVAPRDHSDDMGLSPEVLDKVMSELVAVSASATSKREEAANLARIWGRRTPPKDRVASA